MVRILPSSEAQPERRGPENQATVANSSSEPGSSEATGSSGHRLQERPALQIFKQQASTELPLRLQVPNYVNSSHEEIGGDFSQGVSRPSHVPEEEGLAMVRQNSSKLRGKSFMLQSDKDKVIYEHLARATSMYTIPKGLLDPRKPVMQRWDLVIAALLVFTAVVTPFEVAFVETRHFYDPLFIINRIVDLLFTVDIVIHFNLMYLDQQRNAWVISRAEIARTYLLGSFLIDFISVLPFDALGLIMHSTSVQKLKILRILRLLRLFKLLRIIRSGRVFSRLEDIMDIGYAMITLFKFIFGTLAIAHWMACAWMLCQIIEESCKNWVVSYFDAPLSPDGEPLDYCDRVPVDVCLDMFPGNCQPDESCEDGCGFYWENQSSGSFLGKSVTELYVTSFYWSIVTMATIGYGDVLPNTHAERVFTTIAMMFGTSVFAYVVGSVCGIVQNLDRRTTQFYELMDNLGNFAKENHLSPDLLNRLRAYFKYRARFTSINEWGDLMHIMSPALRGEVAMLKCGEWVSSVPYFARAPEDCIVEIAMRLATETFPQTEIVFHCDEEPSKMYIVERGIIGCKGRVIVRGKVIGAELMLTHYPSDYVARALTYADLFALNRRDIEEITKKYPDVATALRKATCKEICRRQSLAFVRVWRDVRTGKAHRDMFSRSSFQNLALKSSPLEAAKRSRENFIRETAIKLAPLMCKGGSPPFQQLTAVSMSQLILEDEVRQREDELDPVKQLKQELASMALEQKGIVSELSQLSRMVQTLNARLVQPNQASPVNDLDEMRPAASRQVMSANG